MLWGGEGGKALKGCRVELERKCWGRGEVECGLCEEFKAVVLRSWCCAVEWRGGKVWLWSERC